jgi:RNA recognition motif-containing protein
VTEEQIAEFLEGYNFVEGSLKFHMNEEGRKSGMAAVLFASEEDAERACKEKQRQDLGGRNCNLWDLELEEYNDFENWDPEAKDVRCGDSVNEDNVERCVKLRGLPWAANKGTVIEFFDGFKLKKKNVTIDI